MPPDDEALATRSTCNEKTPLFGASGVMADPQHACFAWVNKVFGRVARSGAMSAVVWSLATPSHTGLVVSAAHTMGEGFFAPGGEQAAARARDPANEEGIPRLLLAGADGELRAEISPLFLFFNPEIPAAETGSHMTNIRPEHDFYLAVLDSQRLQSEPMPEMPGPMKDEPPAIWDPEGLAVRPPTIAAAQAGGLVLLLGYPMDGPLAGKLAASVARVLSDSEARAAIDSLHQAGDDEGKIAYDPQAEAVVEGVARPGMSGGGAFDREGRLLGILVRASGAAAPVQYARLVRMTHIDATVRAHAASTTNPPSVIARYLESP